jgi:hypothetical protein
MRGVIGIWLAALALGGAARGQTPVLTGHYDPARSGANLSETVLNPQVLKDQQFGRLGVLPVAGCVVAQPLYVPQVDFGDQGTHNVVFVATSENFVYGFDADSLKLLVQRQLGTPVPSGEISPVTGYYDFPNCDGIDDIGPVGVTGTPVIDLSQGAMFLVAAQVDQPDLPHRHMAVIYKVGLSTLQDLTSPVEITGSFGSDTFDARYELQRAALLEANGNIYVAFASHNDETPYHGWMFIYDGGLEQRAVYDYSPGRSGMGIWQSGAGPVWDGFAVYITTGNSAEGVQGPADYGDSILKIDPDTLEVIAKTSFPSESNNWDYSSDLDLGSSRVMAIPGTPFAVSGSKYGDMFVVRRDDMSLVSRFQAAARHSAGFDWTGIYNGLAFWNQTLYVWPGGGKAGGNPQDPYPTDVLKAFSLSDSGSAAMVAIGQTDGVGLGYQGAGLAISANGSDPASGIVWALTPDGDSRWLRPGYLRAYAASAAGIFTELWHDGGDYNWAKLSQPLVANGRVYTPTFSGEVVVYGLVSDSGSKQVTGVAFPRPRPR